MATVKVPKTPRSSFNKSRKPSTLLLDQIRHLEWAVLPASQRKPHQLPKGRVRTEAQAAERIGQLTTMLVEEKAKAAAAAAPSQPLVAAPMRVKLPPLPPASPKPRARATSSRKRTSTARRTARKSTTSSRSTSRPRKTAARRRK